MRENTTYGDSGLSPSDAGITEISRADFATASNFTGWNGAIWDFSVTTVNCGAEIISDYGAKTDFTTSINVAAFVNARPVLKGFRETTASCD